MSALTKWLKRHNIIGVHPVRFCVCGHINGRHRRMHGSCYDCRCTVFTDERAEL